MSKLVLDDDVLTTYDGASLEVQMKKTTTPESRRMAVRQALANTRIEGHVPTQQFMADVDAMVQGKLTADQMVARSLERARSMPPGGDGGEGEAAGRERFR